MSLVGPRPTSFHASTYSLWHTQRLEAPPGITGLWQVTGRNAMTFDERLRLDIFYIENRSFLLDLKILFQTFTTVLGRSGA
jgi:lipopolysaccharide/colanic/teichoic acid biosynthesis glycosyltransferase